MGCAWRRLRYVHRRLTVMNPSPSPSTDHNGAAAPPAHGPPAGTGHSHGISPHRFPFPSLAALAGRAALGGERETALAALMAARLAAGLATLSVPPATRGSRAAAARAWLTGLALPPALRTPLARVVDASAGEDRLRLAQHLRSLSHAASTWLDSPSRSELERLALLLGDTPSSTAGATPPSTAGSTPSGP
jgi:hypothetical protein